MEEIVTQIARFIGRLLLELLWYFRARLILPLVSLGFLGFLQVQPLAAKDRATWWQSPFKRLLSGQVEVSVSMASTIGFMMWGLLFLCIVLHYGVG
ncbi:hypothetical protein MicloDRAFT_00017440 [Microvirga lotononidis]|uniref:Uncharacterized protein n=1 Tax=Microvirga lotononidis TaxID=864069 RepID=I4YZ80_9HYPH|nr:hypothetical protein MicloDRAFT_00017440 [Microvirga lotononidis]